MTPEQLRIIREDDRLGIVAEAHRHRRELLAEVERLRELIRVHRRQCRETLDGALYSSAFGDDE